MSEVANDTAQLPASAALLAIDVLTGRGAPPPQANGEPVFANPSEARLFGIAHGLVQAGVLDWDGFRAALIVAVAAAEGRMAEGGAGFDYYACFAQALESLLARGGVLTAQELDARSAALAARLPGHDHRPAAPVAAGRD